MNTRQAYRWLPGLTVLKNYRREWLAGDLFAGLVLTTVLVPVGMGYAEACGLPVIYGLYASISALIAYALFGPSRILVLGPDSSLVPIIAATILPLAGRGTDRAIVLAGALAILSGVLCIAGGLARLGFITDLLSKPVRYGYLNAIALTLLVAQLPKILGFPVSGHDFIQETVALAEGIFAGQTNCVALAIGTSCLLIILMFKRFLPKFPGVLIAVMAATIATQWLDLNAKYGLNVVGPLPHGLPSFAIPSLSYHDLNALCASAVAIALVSFADMSVVSRTFAMRGGYTVDDNQELVALGTANILAGFFQGFSVSSSMSRTPVAEAAGGKTQMTSIFAAICLGILLIFAPGLLHSVPSAALAAVVIAACLSLVEIRPVVRLYRMRSAEFLSSIACFLGVVLLGVIQGIFIAVSLALFDFIWRAWRPHYAVLGRVDGMKGYHDITRHPEARRIPGLVIFRWDAPLFFANARVFHECLLKAMGEAPDTVQAIIIAAEPITDVDTTGADCLAELEIELDKRSIELCFAEMKGPVKDHLKRYGLFDQLGSERFYPTLGQAINAYVEKHSIDWLDWNAQRSDRGKVAEGTETKE